MKNELIIRNATDSDFSDLAEISRNTWDGDDYLEKTLDSWLAQNSFFVGETQGKVVACVKITSLPGEVAWLEGLRVHSDFRGRGIGRQMSDSVLHKAKDRVVSGEFQYIEFSTYISNIESRSMSEKQGFRVIEQFHVVSMENPAIPENPIPLHQFSPSEEDSAIYPMHIPCGWKYILPTGEQGIKWLKKNAEFWKTDSGAAFLVSNRGSDISPLSSSMKDPDGFVKGMLSLAALKKLNNLETMIHDSHREILQTCCRSGFRYWEEQGVANLPVYRFQE